MADEKDEDGLTTTGKLAAGAAGMGLFVLGAATGTATADDGSASGDVASAATPALHIYTEEVRFHERSADPTTAPVGSVFYNPNP